MTLRFIIPGLLAALTSNSASAQSTRICLAPASIETVAGNAADAMSAVRETFTSFLTGPSIAVAPLTARLQSQVREEAKASGCPYLLLPTLEHRRKDGGNGLLGRVAGSAVQQGAWSIGSAAGSTVGRAAAGAAAGAASAVAYGSSVKVRDELTLKYRLESIDGRVLVEKSDKRKAQSDREDLLTPMVEKAAESVVAAARRQP